MPELVYTFAFRAFELESGTQVPEWERIPRAVSTVAEALDRTIAAVQQELVQVAAKVDEERALRRRCGELTHVFENLPGVRSVSRPSYGTSSLTALFRNYAVHNAVPLPQLAESDSDWKSLLARWPSPSVLQLSVVMRAQAVELSSGKVVQPPAPESADQTIAEVLGVPLHRVLRLKDEEAMTAIGSGAFDEISERALAQLKVLAGVAAVTDAPPRERMALPPPEYEGPALGPPWTVFPDPPTSMRWRMGAGEDVMSRWWHFWGSLPRTEQQAYFERFVPPAEWLQWTRRALAGG